MLKMLLLHTYILRDLTYGYFKILNCTLNVFVTASNVQVVFL